MARRANWDGDGDDRYNNDDNAGEPVDILAPGVQGGTFRPDQPTVVSAERDRVIHSPPARLTSGPFDPGPDLYAVFDEEGNPWVAECAWDPDGNPILHEELRRPTGDEYNEIMFKGQIVRGGVVAANTPTGTNYAATMQQTALGSQGESRVKTWGKRALAVGAVGGVGYLAYKGYQRWKG